MLSYRDVYKRQGLHHRLPLQVGAVSEQVAYLPADFQLIPHRGAFVVLDKLEHHAGIVPPGVAVFDFQHVLQLLVQV